MKKVVLFPGQGAQFPGMLAELSKLYPQVQEAFAEGSETLGLDLWHICQHDEAALNETQNTQPVLLVAGIAIWRILQEKGIQADVFAGHSLGEYTALVAADALDFKDAVRLVHLRGKLMQQSVPAGHSKMVAVIGLDNDTIAAVCEQVSSGEVVSPANFNAIGQTVIAGHKTAVDRACEALSEAGAKRIVPLAVSVPSHCALMNEAAQQLEEVITNYSIRTPCVPVISNALNVMMVTEDVIRPALCQQLYKPVRWVENVQLMVAQGITSGLECGPSNVLSTLVKRIDKSLVCKAYSTPESIESL